MTESGTNDFDSIFVENEEVADANNSSSSAVDLEVVGGNNGKNDIKVCVEGVVAKLTFGFLDDMQGGDSSLEPGEVKTPPPGSSPATVKESTPSRLAQERQEPPAKQLAKETLAKALKTVSQLEAEACEEKVRAILELDAKRRKEEVEKRKLEAEKRRQSGEADMELERKRKAKEERKKLKKLKKAKKAADKALNSCEQDNDEEAQINKRKIIKTNESEESEGLCSSGADDDNATSSMAEKHSNILNSAIAIPSMPPARYPPHMPPPHLLPEAFMGGFRPMNPFMRGPRPEFSHGRGGFIPRGRGGMRGGRMPFQGFRPPFFAGVTNSAGGPLKFNVPHGPHVLQQQRHHHTPPPNRGHSPILPPTADLQWTKCKPSLSYAFKFIKEHNEFHGIHADIKQQSHNLNREPSEENWDDDIQAEAGKESKQDDLHKHQQHEQIRKKDKKHKSLSKEKKKSKKYKEKDAKKTKRSRTSVSSSIKHKKKSNKSSRRKIEKIRKSYGSSNRSTPTQQEQSSEDTETTNENAQEEAEEDKNDTQQQQEEQEKMPSEEEIRNKVENIKREKIETTELKIEDLTLKVKPLIIKMEPVEEELDKETKSSKETQSGTKNEVVADFDIFAESPPPQPSSYTRLPAKHITKEPAEQGSVTPPLQHLNEAKVQKSSTLQNALEIQKRIDKLLQQDDIKLEAIEAAKNLLMKKTQKHQSTKEKLTPERELNKATEQNKLEESSKATAITHKEESSTTKEKPKAYKDKESNKKPEQQDKEKQRYSKHREEKNTRLKDKSRTSSKDQEKDKNDDNKTKSYDKDRDKMRPSEKDYDKDKSRKEVSSTYRNPFKRSISRDRFFGKIDSRRRTRTNSREHDFSIKRRLSKDRKRGDSSGYSSSRISSKRRISGSSSVSIILDRSKSVERDVKGSLDSLNSKEKERKNRKREKTPEMKQKRKHSSSPKRKSDKEKDTETKLKQNDKTLTKDLKSNTPPPKVKSLSKENKKSKSPIKPAAKKRPLSFTQTEFLFPEEGNEDDFIMGDDEETNDSFKNHKSPSDKEDSPDTDDYMDNWENDEDVDLDMNSNMPNDMSTPRKSSPYITEEDSFVTRFVNPSPPKELLHSETETKEDKQQNVNSLPLTPPLDLLKKLPKSLEFKERSQENIKQNKDSQDNKIPVLFGMQELYDQFIKSVEASGVNMKSNNQEQTPVNEDVVSEKADIISDNVKETHNQNEDPLSTSSTSTSSTTSSSSSSSSESSSNSSSSSSSDSSSEDSNDGDEFKETNKPTMKKKLEETMTPNNSTILNKKSSDIENIIVKSPLIEREPRTPSPSPLQKSLLIAQTPPTPVSQSKATPKSDVAKDFKKLKNLEANLSRIQMMRANYDSNDEISEELHKMEMLFLQEKKIILQKYAKTTAAAEKPAVIAVATVATSFVPALPANEYGILPPPPPPEEPNNIFDTNREAIKLTISPMKLPSKPAIFNVSQTEETEKKTVEDKDEIDFTDKLVKPAKEVAIVKPMMETKESKESRSRDTHRHRRSPVYAGIRERQRSPSNYRERNRRSTSRNHFSPQRRGRGRSLSISPPRRGVGAIRHGTPPRRGAPCGRFRVSNRRSRSRSPLRQFGNRRGKDGSPFRRKRGQQSDLQSHYKKFARHRGSRSRSPRSPQNRPRSPRTPPPRRRSFSPDPYSRSPLPFKPPSPPMRRSLSPMDSPSSPTRRSRSPASPRRPRSPRSPRSPQSPLSPRSPRSPRSPDSPHSHRYDEHRYRRDSSFDRQSSISPHPQYYTPDSLAAGVSSQASSYYYNVSPNRISLDARINIVLNAPGGGGETPPAGYEGYTNYAQYGGSAYMSIPPQPMADPANSMSYYPNPYVPLMSSAQEAHHSLAPPNAHALQHVTHTHPPNIPPHLHQQPHSPAYSNIPTINSGVAGPSSPLPPNNFYYNDYNMVHQPSNPVLKELPKAPLSVVVQKGNVLEIVPSNIETAQSPQLSCKTKTSPILAETIKSHIDKISSISWKDEVNNRHVKSAVMRLNRGGENVMRSILKRSEATEKSDKIEKKKVYFEDGIYPSRDSEDEDRKLIEYKIRKKVLRLRKKRGIELPAARELGEEKSKHKLRKPKIDAALEKLPPPPPPTIMPAATLEQPIYLRPPTPVPLVYFHFDSVVHSMYVSQLEKPIPPRLLNPKCVPGAGTPSTGPVNTGAGSSANATANRSPNLNLPSVAAATKKELTTLAALNRVVRNENAMNSPKMMPDHKRESPNSQQSPLMTMNKPSVMHFTPTQTSPQMSPLHGPAIRHPPSPIGFVGMRINNFMRLPPSPLTRATAVPPHMQAPPPNIANLPPVMRHPQYNMPPPVLMPPGMPLEPNYNSGGGSSPYAAIPQPTPGYHGYGQRPINSGFFMGPASTHTMHPPPPIPASSHAKDKDHMLHHQQQHHHHHQPHPNAHAHLHPQQHQPHHHNQHKPPPLPPPIGSSVVAASPQAMIAPYNVKKTVN